MSTDSIKISSGRNASPPVSEAVEALSHPSIAVLQAYHEGRLDLDSQERILDHLADCQDCTILLLYGLMNPFQLGTEPGLPEQVLDETWARLRSRLPLGCEREQTLASILAEQGQLRPIQRVAKIGADIAAALAEIHARGQVLSALRPETILLDSDGRARIVEATCTPVDTSWARDHLPAQEAWIDFYRFLSPEQVVRDPIGPASNLFSLGVVLYELLTGFSPFRASTALATAARLTSFDPVPITDLARDVDQALALFVELLLAKDPVERPRDASLVAYQLDRFAGEAAPPKERESLIPGADLEAAIDSLYDDIIRMSMGPGKGEAIDELESAFARLLELQQAEAEGYRETFEASLEMPLDAGERILDRARELRQRLESLAARDTATTDTITS